MKIKLVKLIFTIVFVSWCAGVLAAEPIPPPAKPSSGELTTKSWIAHGKRDIEATNKYTQECIDLYKEQAKKEQASLTALPKNKYYCKD